MLLKVESTYMFYIANRIIFSVNISFCFKQESLATRL